MASEDSSTQVDVAAVGVAEITTGNQDLMESMINRNKSLAARPTCFDFTRKRACKCRCLEVMVDREDYCQAIAEYQIMFSRLHWAEQKKTVIEWMRVMPDGASKISYRIPFILDASHSPEDFLELRKATICANSLMNLLNKGYDWWKTCMDHYKNMTMPSHRLCGRISNNKRKFLSEFEEDLISHFEELKKEAEPIATRYVREATGESTLRDANDKLVFLPSYLTVRGCYARFCWEKRGIKISTTNNGTVEKTAVVDGVVGG